MTLPTILPLLSGILVLLLGIFVISKNTKSKVHRIFLLQTISISVWLFGTFMMFISRTDEQAVFWDRFIYMGVSFIPAFMYHFSLVWAEKKGQRKWLGLSYILAFIFLILSQTKYFVDDVFRYSWGVHTQARLWHHIFLVQFFIFIIVSYVNFLQYYSRSISRIKKNQTKYFFLAFFILVVVGLFAYLPAYKVSVYPFSYSSGLLFAVILAYAIAAHHLMDIKLVLRRSFVYLFTMISIVVPAIGLEYLVARYFDYYRDIFNVCLLILSVSLFSWFRKKYYHVANKYFFSSLYDSAVVIEELSDKLRTSLKVKKICHIISKTLIDSFHLKIAGVLIYHEKENLYEIICNHGFQVDGKKVFKKSDVLHKMFIRHNKSVVVEEIGKEIYKEDEEVVDLLRKLKVEVLTPLNIKNKNIGLIALGPKESGDMYNDEDLRVLGVVGAQAAVALQNASLYEESLEFGRRLTQEVDRATKDLKTANKRLTEMDKTKTEFISVASHQLRTPLSGIKGYLSMLIEGDFGVLKSNQKKIIKELFENNERLVRLVNVFLNISRIESGRLKLDKKTVQLEGLVHSAVHQMETAAKNKDLKLEFFGSKEKLPEIEADPDKMMDVILNLIDNAIKYTLRGGIKVGMELAGNKIRVQVADTGVGITQEQLQKLFNKFTRGEGANKMNTTGSGLGLFIAKKIVEMHGGKIWGESEGQGKGTKFIFELPV